MAAPLVGPAGTRMKPGSVFYKMSGSGNDFVMFDGRHVHASDLTPETVVAICDRRRGIGADGVGLLQPPDADAAGVHFSFKFWNSDGSVGPMCGNGALCVTRLAVLLEFAREDEEVRFATDAGIHRGRVVPGEDRAVVALPDCPLPRPATGLPTLPGEQHPQVVRPSVPHLVLLVDDVAAIPVAERGPKLRGHPALGPEGANVNWLAPGANALEWNMRTFERGVEGETLACGTGAVACALALASRGLATSRVTIRTRSGLPLEVSFQMPSDGAGRTASGTATDLHLRGEARLVYRGILSSLLSDTGSTD